MTEEEPPELEKYLWTEEDFGLMGWHDVKVHALSFQAGDVTYDSVSEVGYYPIALGSRLLLDLDYVVKWVRPVAPERYYRFWVSPATLVFENVQRITGGEFDLLPGYDLKLDIDSLERSARHPSGVSEWAVEGHNFTLALTATGFRQYLRRPPMFSEHGELSLEERGGISFSEETAG